jgi:DNA-binding MarR family transcriptional regulator
LTLAQRFTSNDNQGVILAIDNKGVNHKIDLSNGAAGMASVNRSSGAASREGADHEDKGEAIAELMLEIAQCFFRIRAMGQKTGHITSWGGGAFGFMRSLALLGPLTVPDIAGMRPTSRQRMQRLADELAAEGLVEFIDNPRHRRSKLVRLTEKGEKHYHDLSSGLLAVATTLGADFADADIRTTLETLRRLSEAVKVRTERLA